MHKNNIIDFTKLRPFQGTKKSKPVGNNVKAPVVDMTARRQEIINQERREVRRTILTGFIGAFVVVPKKGLLRVDIYDISENGIAFDLDASLGQFKRGEEVAMRVYMNQNTYFPFVATVQNVRPIEGDTANRHGLNFVKGTVNDEALYHFVKFIETVSASLEKDTGDVMVSNLKK